MSKLFPSIETGPILLFISARFSNARIFVYKLFNYLALLPKLELCGPKSTGELRRRKRKRERCREEDGLTRGRFSKIRKAEIAGKRVRRA